MNELAGALRRYRPHPHYYSYYDAGYYGSHLTWKVIGVAVIILIGIHLLGGLLGHAKHRVRHGARPDLYYTYGRGWYGSVALPGGFRLGHRLGLGTLATLAVIVIAFIVAVRVA